MPSDVHWAAAPLIGSTSLIAILLLYHNSLENDKVVFNSDDNDDLNCKVYFLGTKSIQLTGHK